MMKKSFSILLVCCFLFGVMGSFAQETTADYATLDDLPPCLTEGRPDMAMAEPITVTVTDKDILFAPASGKNTFPDPILVRKGDSAGYLLKWNDRKKAYVISRVTTDVDPTALDTMELSCRQRLKKDAKISRQLKERMIEYRFAADTGACQHALYLVILQTKAGLESYMLKSRFEGGYLAWLNDSILLFDRSGKRVTLSPVTAPNTAEELNDLPEMDFASISYHLPVTLQERFLVKTGKGFKKIRLRSANPDSYLPPVPLAYSAEDDVWQSAPLNEIPDWEQFLLYTEQEGMSFELHGQSPNSEEVVASIVFDHQSLNDWVFKALLGHAPYIKQPAASDSSNLSFQRTNEFGVVDRKIKKEKDKLSVRFFNALGEEPVEKDFDVPALALPQSFETPVSCEAHKKREAALKTVPAEIKEIIGLMELTPPWTPEISKNETKWTMDLPQEIVNVFAFVFNQTDPDSVADDLPEEKDIVDFHKVKQKWEVEGKDLEIFKNGKFITLYMVEETKKNGALGRDGTSYKYDFSLKRWRDISWTQWNPTFLYYIDYSFKPIDFYVICFSRPNEKTSGSRKLWEARYDKDGKLIPESVVFNQADAD